MGYIWIIYELYRWWVGTYLKALQFPFSSDSLFKRKYNDNHIYLKVS